MQYRLANLSDIENLATIHFNSDNKQIGGLVHKLGHNFLRTYYKFYLEEKNSLILIAEDENGFVHGFISGTLAVEEYLNALRSNRIKLAFSSLPVFFKSPKLFWHLKERCSSILLKGKPEHLGYIKGPWINYWACLSENKSQISESLFITWLNLVFNKGIALVRMGVDPRSCNILSFLINHGAEVVMEFKLKDGRPRIITEFVNNKVNVGYIIRNMSKTDLNDVIQIHNKAFPGFFLTQLGRDFLYDLYKNFIVDPLSICLVAEIDSFIKGFVVGNMMPDNLFRKMLIKQGYLFLLHSFKAMIRNPILVSRRLLYAVQYRGECPKGFIKPALLSSIGVDPGEGTKGIGSHLINAFCWEAFSKGSDIVYLTTDKFRNNKVNAFYIKNGFKLLDTIENDKGREMNRYIKFPDEKNI